MTRTIRDINTELAAEAGKVFDTPTRWTTGAFYVRPATKKRQMAELLSRQFATKGTPGGSLLRHWFDGGTRKAKGSERLLRDAGILGSEAFTSQGKGVEKDGHGNMPSGKYVSILSALKAFQDKAASANRTGKYGKGKRGKELYFVSTGTGRTRHLAPGIYERGGLEGRFADELMPTLVFLKKQPNFKARINLPAMCDRIVAANMTRNFIQALDGALKSARGGPIKSAYVDHLKRETGTADGAAFSMTRTTRAGSSWDAGSDQPGMQRYPVSTLSSMER
ncbi:MAG: hypothetical protein HQL42_13075 [Alphaproteobacteria bacterium]|nr:hypothetical protein [Alphaproteobacteria bacterium]